MSTGRSALPLETRTSKPTELSGGMESTDSLSGSLGVMVNRASLASSPWFLDLCVLTTGVTVPYEVFDLK